MACKRFGSSILLASTQSDQDFYGPCGNNEQSGWSNSIDAHVEVMEGIFGV